MGPLLVRWNGLVTEQQKAGTERCDAAEAASGLKGQICVVEMVPVTVAVRFQGLSREWA